MTSCLLPLLFLLASLSCYMANEPAGCKIRITKRGLDMLKFETQTFVEEELSNITMPEMKGSEGRFQYTIKDNITMPEMKGSEGRFQYTITDAVLSVKINADLSFQPDVGLLFGVQNTSITLRFHRRILYWFFNDTGYIDASADGVNINTALRMTSDDEGRMKISNVTCDSSIDKMKMKFSGTLGRAYDDLATFLDLPEAMRFLLNELICPALNHSAMGHINTMLETIPVRTEVDNYIGIDYALLRDPTVTSSSLDMDFKGAFFELSEQQAPLVNTAVDPVISEYDRMVYLALSEFFFDSGFYSYYQAGIFQLKIANERMSTYLVLLLRGIYYKIMTMNPALLGAPLSLLLNVTAPPKTTIKTSGATVAVVAIVKVMVHPPGGTAVQLSSMTMEATFNAKVSMKGKRLTVTGDLLRFKIRSNQSALESLALFTLQAPLKTMLQISVVPLLNNWTKRGVQIPLADGMDFIEEVVEYHNGYIVIGANLHFTTGLRDMIQNKIDSKTNSTA